MDWWMTPLFHVRGIPASPFAIAMILFIFFSCVSLIGGRFKKKEEKTANSQVEGRRAKQQVDAAAKKEAEAAKRAESERRNKELAAKRQEEQEKQEREASTTKHLVLQNPEQDNKKNTGVVVAVSEEVMILYAQCVVAKVPDGIIKLANAGMTWIVDYPTEVTVITHGDAISKVRINSGPSRGKDAWVGTEWIKEIKEK